MDHNAQVFILLLEEIRLQKNMSRYKLAKLTGLPESTIKRVLDLENEPSLSNFLAIAKALEINFFFETRDSETDLSKGFEDAMEKLGRRPNRLSDN